MTESKDPGTATCTHCGGESFGIVEDDGEVVGARCQLCEEVYFFETGFEQE